MKTRDAVKACHFVCVLAGLTLIALLGRVEVCWAGQGTWTQKTGMPTARYCHAASVVDGIIYVIGGAASEPGSELVLPVEAYHPATDSWTRKSSIPTGRVVLSTSVVNGKIYVIGGVAAALAGLSTVEEYDPITDTWVRKADMPTPRGALSTSVVDGKIYAIGGTLNLNSLVGVPTVEMYDPTTDIWTRKANMPTPRFALSTSVVDGRIYAIGGGTQSPGGPIVEVYDPSTDTWTPKASMPTGRRNFATCVLAGRIYAIGGWERSSLYAYSTVEQYDPAVNTWTTEIDLPTPRACLSASVVDERIYAIGGTDKSHPCPALATVYELAVSGPPLDLDGNGRVDIEDLLRLIASWGQADPVCDIAPAPFGDGIVDAADLERLMSCWGQDVDDPTLVAHWPLDETDGIVVHDLAGGNDGTILGVPQWRPQGGRIGGALELDGTTFVTAQSPMSPADGPFSVIAWIKGGAPGQAIFSQGGAANWLMVDAIQGSLMTGLSKGGRGAVGLSSQAIITDGNWHRAAFTWDGASRRLHVDGVLVAEDAHDSLAPSFGNVIIGTDKDMSPGTFWTGLIDDVRIYNRGVKP